MKKLLALVIVITLASCAKVAFTGRSQTKLIPDAEINAMSFAQYDQYLTENRPVTGGAELAMVKEIGANLVKATEVYYRANGLEAELSNFQWEFNVVDDPTVNAFCMPGGKVVIYTGIIDVAQNEDGLAVVMGHEIAHALAHHGNERMTQGLMTQAGTAALDIALQEKPAMTRNLLLTAVGLGTQIGVMLPFSRKHESEADEIGLYLMAMAGYNPNEAAPFWQRMAGSGGQSPPEFLSTHPNPERRSSDLNNLVAKSLEYKAKYPVPGSTKR
ncbi:MAG: M48 family metallopeptidase [Bacteroidota bacterium]